jgi:PAS domain S-box-containing protein
MASQFNPRSTTIPRYTASTLIPVEEKLCVLVVDDNTHLVEFIVSLLKESCKVLTAFDGLSGLSFAREYSPDLIIVDVIMPGLDGFELLREIRADAAIHTVPIIILSGDASEDARLEALRNGADDFLIKPFKPKELIARIHSHVRMVRLRRAAFERESELLRTIGEVQQDLQALLEGTNDAFMTLSHELYVITHNQAAGQLVNTLYPSMSGRSLLEVAPGLAGGELVTALLQCMKQNVVVTLEYQNTTLSRWYGLRCYPTRHGLTVFGADITEQKLAELALLTAHSELEARVTQRTLELRQVNDLLTAVFDNAPSGIAILDSRGRFIQTNTAYCRLLGKAKEDLIGHTFKRFTDVESWACFERSLQQLADEKQPAFDTEMPIRLTGRKENWVSAFVSLIHNGNDAEMYFVKIAQDITARKRAEEKIATSQRELRALYHRLESVREEERVSLAREVHDQLGQLLSAAKIDIKLLEDDAQRCTPKLSRNEVASELRSARLTLDKAISSVRAIATELRPPELEDHGIYGAIELYAKQFTERTGIETYTFVNSNEAQPRGPAAIALFRIFQEAMSNIQKHSIAGAVHVYLLRRGNSHLLRVADDGIGITAERALGTTSLGLRGMRERAAIARGKLLIRKIRPHGTLVAVRIPIHIEND